MGALQRVDGALVAAQVQRVREATWVWRRGVGPPPVEPRLHPAVGDAPLPRGKQPRHTAHRVRRAREQALQEEVDAAHKREQALIKALEEARQREDALKEALEAARGGLEEAERKAAEEADRRALEEEVRQAHEDARRKEEGERRAEEERRWREAEAEREDEKQQWDSEMQKRQKEQRYAALQQLGTQHRAPAVQTTADIEREQAALGPAPPPLCGCTCVPVTGLRERLCINRCPKVCTC